MRCQVCKIFYTLDLKNKGYNDAHGSKKLFQQFFAKHLGNVDAQPLPGCRVAVNLHADLLEQPGGVGKDQARVDDPSQMQKV